MGKASSNKPRKKLKRALEKSKSEDRQSQTEVKTEEKTGVFFKIKSFIKRRKITVIGALTFVTLLFAFKDQIVSTFFTTKQESQTEELIAVGKMPPETELRSKYLLLKEVVENISSHIPFLDGKEEVKKYEYNKGRNFLIFVEKELSAQLLSNSYLMANDSLLNMWQFMDRSIESVINLSIAKYNPSTGQACDTCFDGVEVELMKSLYFRMYEPCIEELFSFLPKCRSILESEKRFSK